MFRDCAVIFVLDSKYNTNTHHAIFVLKVEPKFEFPAVSLDFELESEDWKDYDPEEQDLDNVNYYQWLAKISERGAYL